MTPPAPTHRYSRLLACLIALPLAEALSLAWPPLELLYWAAFLAVLLAGLYGIDPHDRSHWDEWAIILPAVLALLTVPIVGVAPRQYATLWIAARHGAGLLALGALAIRILRDVLKARVVVFDQICGGLCVYMLVGFAFALTFSAIERIHPGSFAIDRARYGIADDLAFLLRLRALLSYFSFITLTTVGYGDITPVADLPRALAAVEAVLGQIYLAVFVARLVSLNLAAASVTVSVEPAPHANHHLPTPHHRPTASTPAQSPTKPH
jgi:hypothetical protein